MIWIRLGASETSWREKYNPVTGGKRTGFERTSTTGTTLKSGSRARLQMAMGTCGRLKFAAGATRRHFSEPAAWHAERRIKHRVQIQRPLLQGGTLADCRMAQVSRVPKQHPSGPTESLGLDSTALVGLRLGGL